VTFGEGWRAEEMTDQKPDGPEWRYEEAQRAHDKIDAFVERLDTAAIKSSETALGACLVINGGAEIAVLSFIGGLASKDAISIGGSNFNSVADSLVPFAFGVIAAVAGMALSYLVHLLTVGHARSHIKVKELSKTGEIIWVRPGKKTWIWGVFRTLGHAVAALAGVASVVLFVCGIFAVRDTVERIQPASHTQTPSREAKSVNLVLCCRNAAERNRHLRQHSLSRRSLRDRRGSMPRIARTTSLSSRRRETPGRRKPNKRA